MAWKEGIVVRGGELAGETIGISDTLVQNPSNISGTNIVAGESSTVYDVTKAFYNNDLEKMIDISSSFVSGLAPYAQKDVADIAILNDGVITAYLSLFIQKTQDTPYMIFNVAGKIKNANGTIRGDLRGGFTINFQNSNSYPAYLDPEVYVCFAEKVVDGHKLVGLYFNGMQLYQDNRNIVTKVYGGAYQDMTTFYTQWQIHGDIDDKVKKKSPEFGPGSEPGGYGGGGSPMPTHNHGSDHNKIPSKPQYGFTSAGFLNHYNISSQGLTMLGEALFPAPILSSPDVPTAIDRMTANMWNSKIIDYVIDCRIIPVKPHDDGYHNITCGGKVLVHPTTGAVYTGALIDEDFVDVDCGYVETPPTEGNFLDYYQLSCKLFLPFYGYVDIAPEYWNGAKIGVVYRFNMMDGSFMVWITSKAFASDLEEDDIIAQYAGNACIHLPINSMSYSNIVSGMITTGAAIVGTAAGGAVMGSAATGAAASKIAASTTAAITGQVASGAANVINSRPQLNANNSYNGSASLMSARRPHLLIEFNNAQFSTKYVDEKGLPLVVEKRIGSMHGMTICEAPIINFDCTEGEALEIIRALQEGVIV